MSRLIEKNWKNKAKLNPGGWFDLQTEDTGDIPVRLFFSQTLLDEADEDVYPQIVAATGFPGTKMVILTPDAHPGSSVPVGLVLITEGTIAMGPISYDIGCGMLCARSSVPVHEANPNKRLKFNQEVLKWVGLDDNSEGRIELGKTVQREFNEIVRGGADFYLEKYRPNFDHSRAERRRIPVDDSWQIPFGGRAKPERGIGQLGSLGAGNHFIELQRCEETNSLFVMIHTGSRGFGHGLAVHYLDLAQQINPKQSGLDSSYFTPDNPHYRGYLNAVAAGANYAIVNRLLIFEQVARAFKKVFKGELELVYEISHNLVQEEEHPDFGKLWVHRKGATRAFPAGHPALRGTVWEDQGHPVLIPGSNKDYSFILRPKPGAVNSGYSVNHGSGRKLSRGAAKGKFDQRIIDRLYKSAGVVVNTDGKVPLDESSGCYKSSSKVIDAVVQANLAEIEYRLYPLASIKGT
jgi:tRNA-splicing ligase RtcB (3'-phosphate/5'-hydroxy nucleic acid ligase)